MNLIESTHRKVVEQGDKATEMPYEAVIQVVRDTAEKLNLSEAIFPPTVLVPMLERYAFEHQRGLGAATWVMDLFLELGIPFETLLSVLEAIFYTSEAPFDGRNRVVIGKDMVYVIKKWHQHCSRNNHCLFGGDDNTATIIQTLTMIMQNGLTGKDLEDAEMLKRKIERELR